MNDVKAWYKSRTVWGALIAIFASLAQAAGVEVTDRRSGRACRSHRGGGGRDRWSCRFDRADFGPTAGDLTACLLPSPIHLPFSVDRLLLASE